MTCIPLKKVPKMVGSFTMEKENLYLLMFERAATSHTLANADTFNQPNSLNDNQVIKEIIEKHKNLLMLRDKKASLTNIKAILQHHNISTQSNRKIANLKELLLKHCNSFSSNISNTRKRVSSEYPNTEKWVEKTRRSRVFFN